MDEIEQYERGSPGYREHNEQYATGSYEEENRMSPRFIMYATSIGQVQSVIDYASKKNIFVAIRTGGHQYSAASSTSGNNILLDMSKFPKESYFSEVNNSHRVRVSVSHNLRSFNGLLAEKSKFVPHGQCGHVCLGGHVQTGGYGQLGRSFGLLGDHAEELHIVDCDCNVRNITRNNNTNLFNAILGGSPGNFCVITHITFRIYCDSDYTGSCGIRSIYEYNPPTLKKLLDILVDTAVQRNYPQNYDYCISVLSAGSKLTTMYPDLEKEKFDDDLEGTTHQKAYIVVFAQWVKLNTNDEYDSRSMFEKIQGCGNVIAENKEYAMSKMTGLWVYDGHREFDKAYIKRTYVTNSKNYLRATQWSDWVTNRIHSMISVNNGCYISAQMQNFGGKRSKFFQNRDNGTSYSWRDSSITCVMDCFYDLESFAMATEWQRQNDHEGIGEGKKFSTRDMRVLWGSFGDFDLHRCRGTYYESDEKYNELCDVKNNIDHINIFTPNTFCVRN